MEFKYIDKVLPKFFCSICKDVLSEPMLTDCCGQHFCKECLDEWFEQEGRKSCPHCRSEGFTHIIDKPVVREINELAVDCPNRELGCKENVTRGKLEHHLTICSHATVECTNKCDLIMFRMDLDVHLREHCERRKVHCQHCGQSGVYFRITTTHLRTCTHLPMECPNKCEFEGLIRKDLRNHLANECIKRQVDCEYCGEQGTFEYITGQHLEECLDVPIPCPRGCLDDDVTRHTLDNHKEVCEMEPVKCTFHDVGCEVEILRKDVNDHNDKNVHEHLVLMMSKGLSVCGELRRENEAQKLEIQALREEVGVLRERLGEMRVEGEPVEGDLLEEEPLERKPVAEGNKCMEEKPLEWGPVEEKPLEWGPVEGEPEEGEPDETRYQNKHWET